MPSPTAVRISSLTHCPLNLIVSLLFFTSPLTVNAAILHVAQDGDGTDGVTWSTGFQTISAAIVKAVSGDQIWVKEGSYNEVLTLKAGLALYGGFSGTESNSEFGLRNWKENDTTIDANGFFDGYGSPEYGIKIYTLTGTIVDGFTITDCGTKTGGGICVKGSSCIIKNCISENNGKGGILSSDSSLLVDNCAINSNYNAGIYISNRTEIMEIPSTVIKNCTVCNNVCYYERGGIAGINANLSIINCIIYDNIITCPTNYNYPLYGGGVYVLNGGRDISDSTTCLNHCTITGNILKMPNTVENVSILAGKLYPTAPDPKIFIYNSIIEDPTKGYYNTYPHIDYRYTNYVPSLVSGFGNISADPKFASTSSSEEYPYQLLPSSPCIDAGTKTDLATDILGASRTIDIPGVGHEGIYSSDMGCYEYQPPAPTPTVTPTTTVTPTPMPTPTMNPKADINEDGRVDEKDLLILEELWGRETGR